MSGDIHSAKTAHGKTTDAAVRCFRNSAILLINILDQVDSNVGLDELALIYEAKGMEAAAAERLATQVMQDPQRMLAEQVQEELKIGDPAMSPLREGWVTGLATGFGAIIPVFPFFFWHGGTAVAIAFALAMASHFAVGAARSIFTGRDLFRSGLDMFVIGVGVAAVGYFVGEWVARIL